MLRQSLMKCSVKNGNLRQPAAKHVTRSLNTLDVGRVVQRREFNAVLDRSHNLVIDLHRLFEVFTTMNNPMTDGMNVSNTLNLRWPFIGTSPTQNQLNCGACISQ